MPRTSLLLLLPLLGFTQISPVAAQSYQTLTYYQDDDLQLDLDLFLPENQGNALLPLVIYVHGGGFSSGERSAGHPFCEFMAGEGFVAASISYTLYMQDKDFSCGGITGEKIKAMQYGANDLWLATSYLIGQRKTYRIDPSKIFIAGSSAGAETCFHAAFWNREQMKRYEHRLPDDFRYAGMIAGAGAIMDLNLITAQNRIPTLMFHGDQDRLVPYGTAAHHYCDPSATGWLMFFGSHSVFEYLRNMGETCSLLTYRDKGHEVAGILFDQNQEVISRFLKRVLDGEIFQEHAVLTD